MVKWYSRRPAECQVCDTPFRKGDSFVDGRTIFRPWAIMCMACYDRYGVGLGTGKGQQYSWTTLEKEAG